MFSHSQLNTLCAYFEQQTGYAWQIESPGLGTVCPAVLPTFTVSVPKLATQFNASPRPGDYLQEVAENLAKDLEHAMTREVLQAGKEVTESGR